MTIWAILIILIGILCLLMISNIIELHNRDHDKKLEINPLIIIIALITVFWLSHIYFLSFQNIYSDFISKHFYIKIVKEGLQLNEWGDYFAGFFAPLIFLGG